MEKRINLLFIGFGLFVSLTNLLFFINTVGFSTALISVSNIYVPVIGTLYFSLLQLTRGIIVKISHIVFLFVISAVGITDDPNSVYGLGFMLMCIYLLYKYGYLHSHFVAKSIGLMAVVYALILTSILGKTHVSIGLNVMAFVLFFFVAFFLGEWQWIQTLRQRDKDYKQRIQAMSGEPIDLEALKFTKREIDVGRYLIHFQETDKEIAWRMQVSPDTVRNHLKSIRRKAGVGTKQQLIEKIRWYYGHEDSPDSTIS